MMFEKTNCINDVDRPPLQANATFSTFDYNFSDDHRHSDADDDYQFKLMALDEAGYGSRTVKALYGFLSRLEIRSKASWS